MHLEAKKSTRDESSIVWAYQPNQGILSQHGIVIGASMPLFDQAKVTGRRLRSKHGKEKSGKVNVDAGAARKT